MEKKVCSKCKEEKPIEEFSFNKAKKDGHCDMCKACFKEYRDRHYREHKEYYKSKAALYKRQKVEQFGELKKGLKCAICGEDRWWVLDFHHTDPSAKDREVSKMVQAPKKIQAEISKCLVLCANCHRDLHYKEKHKK